MCWSQGRKVHAPGHVEGDDVAKEAGDESQPETLAPVVPGMRTGSRRQKSSTKGR
jgi:hypothetical protein